MSHNKRQTFRLPGTVGLTEGRDALHNREPAAMESHEVLREALHKRGVKAIAKELRLSPSLVYKWCQPNTEDSGADNPLDRIVEIVRLTGDTNPVHWLCQTMNGFFVENPLRTDDLSTPVMMATQQLLREFAELLEAVSTSFADDSAIEADEARRIRTEWEQLKTLAEKFVVACEAGIYNANGPQRP